MLSISRRFLKENNFLSFVVFDGSIKTTAQNKICIPLCMKIKIYETFLETFSFLCDYSILILELYVSSAISWLKFEQEVVIIRVAQIAGTCFTRWLTLTYLLRSCSLHRWMCISSHEASRKCRRSLRFHRSIQNCRSYYGTCFLSSSGAKNWEVINSTKIWSLLI